jgi:hypothetical protein
MMRAVIAWCSQRGVAQVKNTKALLAQPGTTMAPRKGAGGNHGYQGNTVPSYVKIHGNDAAGRPLAKP